MKLKQYFYFNNKRYLIRVGSNDGKYILRKGKKMYINKFINAKKVMTGGKKKYKIKVFADFKDKEKQLVDTCMENFNKIVIGTPLFKDSEDLNEHCEWIEELSSRNKWKYTDSRTGVNKYYGRHIEMISKKKIKDKIWRVKAGSKPSDICKSWIEESIHFECLQGLYILCILKLWRIYGEKIDEIMGEIPMKADCPWDNCAINLDLTETKNLDGDRLFVRTNFVCPKPELDINKTTKYLEEDLGCNGTFGYIRSAFGFLPLIKDFVTPSTYTETSQQGHNVLFPTKNGKRRVVTIGAISVYEPEKHDSEKDPKGQLGKYIIIDDIKKWLHKAKSEAQEIIRESNKNNPGKIPNVYRAYVTTKNDKEKFVGSFGREDWYGNSMIWDVYYKVPCNFGKPKDESKNNKPNDESN